MKVISIPWTFFVFFQNCNNHALRIISESRKQSFQISNKVSFQNHIKNQCMICFYSFRLLCILLPLEEQAEWTWGYPASQPSLLPTEQHGRQKIRPQLLPNHFITSIAISTYLSTYCNWSDSQSKLYPKTGCTEISSRFPKEFHCHLLKIFRRELS